MPAKLNPFPNGIPETDECIVWQWTLDGEGYGRWYINGVAKRAHRVVYCIHNDLELIEIDGLVIRHTCDNHPCVNPRHLLIGTPKDNVADMYSRGRQQDNRGVKHHQAKLTESQVLEIFKLSQEGIKQRVIAENYGVSQKCIWSIANKVKWKHLLTDEV